MNWENSSVLTALKRDFLKSFFKIEQNFYLTGGSALGIFYLQHRFSYDLDFFTLGSIEWHIVDNEIRATAESIGAQCEPLTSTPYFHRLKLVRGKETEIIDFVTEKVSQIDPDKNHFGSIVVDTLNEIGINKMCTLLSRSEIKDIIDLYFLEQTGFKIEDHVQDAQKKDAGFDLATISYLLSNIEISSMPQYLAKPLSLDEFNTYIEHLRKRIAELSYPEK
jgi:predicted nucleotidyltransferase component of viral defense system